MMGFFITVLVAAIVTVLARGRTGDAVRYAPVCVERGSLKVAVATTGMVKPQNRVEIKPPISGRIDEVLVDEGIAVKKGQILAVMSSTERAALLDAARAKGESELAYWEKLYKPMPVIAPVSGDIIARNVEPGQTVAANEKMFAMSDRLIVQAQIDETDIGRVKVGQEAEFSLDAYPDEVVTGRVDMIAFEAQTVNNVTMYMVDILPGHVPHHMRSGMTANIQVVTAVASNVLKLPADAVHVENGKSFVWRPAAAGDGKRTAVQVATGLSDGKNIEILSGLKEGDKALSGRVRLPDQKQTGVNPFSPFQKKK